MQAKKQAIFRVIYEPNLQNRFIDIGEWRDGYKVSGYSGGHLDCGHNHRSEAAAFKCAASFCSRVPSNLDVWEIGRDE